MRQPAISQKAPPLPPLPGAAHQMWRLALAGVMQSGFKSPAGALAIAGLMGAPLWAWACRQVARPSAPVWQAAG